MTTSAWSRRIALGIVAATVALQVGHLVARSLDREPERISRASRTSIYIGVTLAFSALYAAVGWAIVTRQPRNTIGWLLLVGAAAGRGRVLRAATTRPRRSRSIPGSLPFGRLAAWVDRWMIVVMLTAFIPLFLLFPDGRIPSPRWRPALWLTIAGPAITVVSFALTPGRMTGAFADLTTVSVINPFGIDGLEAPLHVATLVGGLLARGGGDPGRLRDQSRDTEERRPRSASRSDGSGSSPSRSWSSSRRTSSSGSPAAAATTRSGTSCSWRCSSRSRWASRWHPAIAILKYRLYDLDLVIRKTVVVGAMALFIALVYAVIVGLGSQLFDSSALSFAAAVVLALAFQPVRDRARRLADRLVYGKRATPYEVLADFSGRMGEAYAADDVLPRMAQVLAAGTGRGASRSSGSASAMSSSRAAVFPADVDAARRPPPDDAVDVLHQGERLGALSVTMPASDPMDPAATSSWRTSPRRRASSCGTSD